MHNRYREGVSVQKSEDYKTLIWILLDEITFVIGPDCIFANLWGACDSAVLQCTESDTLSALLLSTVSFVVGLAPVHPASSGLLCQEQFHVTWWGTLSFFLGQKLFRWPGTVSILLKHVVSFTILDTLTFLLRKTQCLSSMVMHGSMRYVRHSFIPTQPGLV